MYFNSNVSGRFHVRREPFPSGNVERVTSGAAEEEGIAMAPDGKSLIPSIGTTQSTVWVHDARGERQISSEGYAEDPEFSRDGRKLYYIILRNGAGGTFAREDGELWVADLGTGQSQRLLGSTLVTSYDLSRDDTEAVFSAVDDKGRSHLWLASLDFRFPPREFISSADEDQPFWGGNAYIYFRAAEGKLNFLYRMKSDGSGRERALPKPIFELEAISPNGDWAIVDEGTATQEVAEPLRGGAPIAVCASFCTLGWSHDGRVFSAFVQLMDVMRTVTADVTPAKELPVLPPEGITEANLEHLKGVKVLRGTIFLGSGNTSAFLRAEVHRNLFRIPLQ